MAAKVALVGGCLLIAAGYFVPPFNKLPIVMHEFHFVAAVFVLLVAVMLVIGKLRPRATDWVQEDSGDVDLTPWKGAVPTGIVLVVLVVIMYASFAGG
jgi:SSS family solute:Na+ symporter